MKLPSMFVAWYIVEPCIQIAFFQRKQKRSERKIRAPLLAKCKNIYAYVATNAMFGLDDDLLLFSSFSFCCFWYIYELSQTHTFTSYQINCQSCQIFHLISSSHHFYFKLRQVFVAEIICSNVRSCYGVSNHMFFLNFNVFITYFLSNMFHAIAKRFMKLVLKV